GDTILLEVLNPALEDNDSSLSDCTLMLGMRETYAYPYSNLWLEVTYHVDDRHIVRDTVNVTLADIYGRWLGKGFGASYQTEIPLSNRAAIDLTIPVGVRHIMRVDTLRGITEVGIEVR
ncbi:MAG: gliding motility lipoprotein GldH, partial [Duncaniella sp.]|nr:gliding motility lipoprotein GldH [Duncaniella sp.]